ncbi:MAG: histidine kinase [Bacteroidota bacterium]
MNINLFQKKWSTHILIWLSYFFLLIWFFTDVLGFINALKRASIIVPLHAGIFYLNSLILLPQVLEKKWKISYYIIIINVIIMIIFTFKFIDDILFIDDIKNQVFFKGLENLPPDLTDKISSWRENNPVIYDRRFFSMRFITNIFSVIMVLLVSTLYRNEMVKREKEEEASLLKNQMLEAESKLLKWQINPHFLFNTLNNIYALSLMKSDRTPDAVHRLSEMLRYVIYDCNEEYVVLEHELNYIKGYIALQLLKDDEISNVHFEFADIDTKLKIAPMLLISYIENSFKHSKIEDLNNGWINIKLETIGKTLHFEVKNSIPEIEPAKDKQGGLGLENVKRRLELIYPGRYNLNVMKTEKEYSVKLTLELNGN